MTEFSNIQRMVRQRRQYAGIAIAAFIAMVLSFYDHARWIVSGVSAIHVVIWVFVLGELSRDIENARQREENAYRARTQTQQD